MLNKNLQFADSKVERKMPNVVRLKKQLPEKSVANLNHVLPRSSKATFALTNIKKHTVTERCRQKRTAEEIREAFFFTALTASFEAISMKLLRSIIIIEAPSVRRYKVDLVGFDFQLTTSLPKTKRLL